jgi:hypothetical protein
MPDATHEWLSEYADEHGYTWAGHPNVAEAIRDAIQQLQERETR